MSLRVEKPGLLTTVQDLGRWGFQQEGVIVSGAMDALAHRTANLLVGNQESAATLEFTLLGPSLRFEQDHLISLTGAAFTPKINGKTIACNRIVLVRKGALLEIGAAKKGCRGYLAVAGGLQVPLVMGSASTYLKAGIGGLNGKALMEGEVVPCLSLPSTEFPYLEVLQKAAQKSSYAQAFWYPSPMALSKKQENQVIRVMKGPEYDWFTPGSQNAFWTQPFKVTAQSDRMGYRLEGPVLGLVQERELLSTAVTFGTVQVPAQGNPIVLLADHQTTGGYPRIAQVITADFPALAQLPPGQKIQWQEVTVGEAQTLFLEQEQHLARLKTSIALKLRK
ncbi:KipI antagonist [Rufibacter radiotolerans]|uniref:KipI antagonist n=1 Tax=Rufibacter radiotolerans TaxID=1379910 RepID=A0A0H4VN51_9BACT|nr:biotin-dependent carboxyltransferase family protein [Rufibacter radiotolerans]AKQ45169.1 KipI antagonist [Rufibacter radiotolerans]